jgi:hypothetical protein
MRSISLFSRRERMIKDGWQAHTFYGTTDTGGTNGMGTVFKINP